ncbi:class I tRNA ligase family protein [Flavitalea sp. BT771]|uniref:leucine--tRNA ligase n=1 Tax=Flavitalea sp. BT771 TaxID=3063329 RepID=UPI0026E1FEF2|nr:class I tRNA ligase family protein [Flavitalea sp. BT771]MDO6433971.1 class I tRNA ligase family protein [Flavitalea sp. BT771]MDV6222871.1 class I tRNA ligase family protein [Flavitalea sp. BT771]
MEYNFSNIEQKWQQLWNERGSYKVSNDPAKPKFYVLDMFPYPSGAGLHVGHPLGYIASDIFARYKRLKGFNVLHPMGYDAFGLPAEQYAIDHGIHPAVSTETNINNFRRQLDNIGFCFDWSREFRTSTPSYYKWTQWIFLQLFKSWYDRKQGKARAIEDLVKILESEGNAMHPCPGEPRLRLTAAEWKGLDHRRKEEILMGYRLSYCGYGEVNWCEALGTVLANDEVINGVSERGGFPVVKKKLRQWYLRITDYADRLLEGLEKVDFSDAMKEMQSNWIGKSFGAEVTFEVYTAATSERAGANGAGAGEAPRLTVYTTRPDTLFGVDFMVVAPEHDILNSIVPADQKGAVEEYLAYVKSRSERERMAEKKITGCFTGAYAIHPFNGLHIPIWTSEYVLAGYGTGAIMAVPCGDERDFKFAQHFNIPVTNIIGDAFNGLEANPTKDAILENSDFLDGLVMKDAIVIAIKKLEEKGIGVRKVNYRMRDAAFSRQRYWGEPFPIVWKEGIATPMDEKELPLELPHIEKYGPGPEGEGPLANIPAWTGRHLETNTMPGYAGSSWYFLRYMDPHNDEVFCSRAASDYWGQVDLYIGGTEHAVGHLLYSRMWTKFLYDRGLIGHDEPYKRLVNQGMIQGSSRFVYRLELKFIENEGQGKTGKPSMGQDAPVFVSYGIRAIEGTPEFHELVTLEVRNIYNDPSIELESIAISTLHVDVNIVDGVELDIAAFRKWRAEYADARFILEEGKYICGVEVEKMSKRLYNTVNPDDLVNKYGADTFRMYEMFLGPVEASKPWDTKGIEGVHRFLRKLWRLFFDEMKGEIWTTEKATDAELKLVYKTIKKVEDATERFSFNTGVSALMIGVNELTDLRCHKKEVLEKLLVILTPYAPHVSEELWQLLGNEGSVLDAAYPAVEEKYLVESTKNYPIAINGKTRTELNIALDATQQQVEELVLADDLVKKWLDGKAPKKVIYVKHKMINVVV